MVSKKKNFSYFIGIDVSKHTLDYAILKGKQSILNRRTENTVEAIKTLLTEISLLEGFKISKALFCIEHTGFYCNHLLTTLSKVKANLIVENPVQIKNSLGVLRGKDDKLDALRIARYAERCKEEYKLWVPNRPVILKLKSMVTVRSRLLSACVILKTPLKEQSTFIKSEIHNTSLLFSARSLNMLRQSIDDINEEIKLTILSDEYLKKLYRIITSVPSVGFLTAAQIIIYTNEFKDIKDPKKFACYAGVAPFKKESGLMKGRSRVSHIANKKMKHLLHMCAMVALRSDSELKAYFDRKTKEGKPGMSVMNALRYKILLRIFACIRDERYYKKNHQLILDKQ